MLSHLVRLEARAAALRDDRGATAVEYGLMASLIAVVIIVAVIALGGSVKGLFELVVSTAPFN